MKTTHTMRSTGPCDGLWTHLVGHMVYTIELSYWADLDSSAIATHGKYNVRAGYVEVPTLDFPLASPASHNAWDQGPHAKMASALRSCGYRLDSDTGDVVQWHDGTLVCERGKARTSTAGRTARRRWLLCIAECMWGYGAMRVLYDGSGNNRRTLFREAHARFDTYTSQSELCAAEHARLSKAIWSK